VVGLGLKPDEILFHELVHAAADVIGARSRRTVGADYDDETEFMAILIANIYMSERHAAKLRKNHLPSLIPLEHPESFLDNYKNVPLVFTRRILETFRNHQMIFFMELALIPASVAWFNPIQQFLGENVSQSIAPVMRPLGRALSALSGRR
jgi:hypothetical protein